MPTKRRPLTERFWDRVTKCENDQCWLWTAGKDRFGYGSIVSWPENKQIGAHRLSWTIHFGEIPAGLNVLHKCDNPACVNPSHLFLGTHADNNRDMIAKGRANFIGSPTGPRRGWKLSKDQAIQIKNGTGTHKEIAARFGVSAGLVSQIKIGLKWPHLHSS